MKTLVICLFAVALVSACGGENRKKEEYRKYKQENGDIVPDEKEANAVLTFPAEEPGADTLPLTKAPPFCVKEVREQKLTTGKMLGICTGVEEGHSTVILFRRLADGALDTTFGVRDVAQVRAKSQEILWLSQGQVVPFPDGRLLVAAVSESGKVFCLAHFSSDGIQSFLEGDPQLGVGAFGDLPPASVPVLEAYLDLELKTVEVTPSGHIVLTARGLLGSLRKETTWKPRGYWLTSWRKERVQAEVELRTVFRADFRPEASFHGRRVKVLPGKLAQLFVNKGTFVASEKADLPAFVEPRTRQ